MAIIITNNGKTTIFTSGEQIGSITPELNTYVLGVDSVTGEFEKLDPNGNIFNFESVSGGTGQPVIETTYNGLVNSITGNTLNPGSYYLITDFQTCYDAPEYYVNGDTKGSNAIDYKQGNVEPIIVLAISVNTISSTAYQPAYPNDRIQYDWTFNTTEITSGIAYGRISERIDEFNNRTDYDHRNIFFNRFQSYNKNSQLTGTISAISWGQGYLIGNGTSFLSDVNPNDILLIDGYQFGGIGVKVISATTDTQLSILTDPTFGGIAFCGETYSFYSTNQTGNYDEYKEIYFGQKNEDDWDDILTFNLNGTAVHNYVGDYSRFYLEDNVSNSGFLLANNVFYGNNIYSNTIGDRSYNNTGRYWFTRNTIAGRFYNNMIHQNGFYSNNIGEYFNNNIIKSSMYGNVIKEWFEENEIYSQFYNNDIDNGFYNNQIYSSFYENKIGIYFDSNKIIQSFYKNDIGFGFYNNQISGETFTNRIGEQFENNTIYGSFYDNQIFNEFKGNITYQDFNTNKVDWGFGANQFSGACFGNSFGPFTTSNDFLGLVFGNVIKGDFNGNTIGDVFGTNNIGSDFYNNTIAQYFANNEIGNFFTYNTIGEGFGFGGFSTQKNYIGDEFYNNTVGEYFYNNRVSNYFQNNTLGDYFQWNVIDTNINLVDFTPNYGNITAFTYTTLGTGTTNGIYTNLNGTTNGHGVNASFNIEVSGNTVIGVSGNTSGKLYNINDTITIPGSQIGGVTGLISGFTTNKLSVKIYKPADSTYEFPDNEIEMDYLIDNSPLFDTYYSPNTQGVSYSTKTGVDQNQYGMVIDGYIQIPSGNTYYFGLSSDDGSDAFINGTKVADWYGAHGDNGNIPDGNQYPIVLTAGTYSVKVRLQERFGQDIVSLLYSSDSGSTWNIIPDNWFPLGITGTTGSYPNIFATGTGGENATFDVTVIDGVVDSVVLSNGGESYSVGEILTIPGSAFGSTEDITITVDSVYSDDVIVTVTGIGTNPSVYEHYTCQIFEKQGGDKRLSYYDSSDILTIKNINE